MDRSFLSQAEVIAASRKVVCVRLTTYENQKEADFLKALWVGGSGEVENTTFAILSPDGKEKLARPGRSPRRAFEDAPALAAALNRIAGQYAAKANAGQPSLPLIADVRLAVNVAACDGRPLVVLYAEDAAERTALAAQLAPLAWSDAFVGRFVYVTSTSARELSVLEGISPKPGLFAIQPDQFGLKGKVLKHISADASEKQLRAMLRDSLASHQRIAKTFRTHIEEGRRQGVFWETKIPVTDPMELRARQRQ